MGGAEEHGFHPFDVSSPHIAYTVLGGFVVLFGMFSLLIKEKLYIGEAPIATVFGIIIGPYVSGIFDPRDWGANSREVTNDITLEVTRVVLAIGVFAIGVELPKQYMLKHWKSLAYLLGPVMTYGWFVSAAFIYGLVPGLTYLSALVIAACLTPTDPILAAAVVGGKYAHKHVPEHLRELLAAESGCNDGAAFPFLFIAIYLTLDASDAHAVGEWFYMTWLYEVALGIVLGALLGFGFRHLMKFCERKNLIDRHSYVAQYISLALLAVGMCTLLGSDDLLAAFACGTAFAWDGWFNKQTEQSQFSNVIDLLFNCACFIYIGAWIPFDQFNSAIISLSAWKLVICSILVMALRRLPAVMALYWLIPDIHTWREAVFSGHFGPMGVGAVFIATLASTKLPEPKYPPENQVELLAATIQPIVAFVVLFSIGIHGLSIPFFSLGKRVHSIRHTWSRHESHMAAGPEWTQQIRRVPARPEDIVINRDPTDMVTSSEDRMEKGLLDEKHSSTGGVSGSGTRTPVTIGEGISEKDTDIKGQEWREGRDLVVESHPGGQEDVEVTVLKNVFDTDGGVLEGVEDVVKTSVAKFRKQVHEDPKSIEQAAKAASRKISMESDKIKKRSSSGAEAKPTSPITEDPAAADQWNDEPMTEEEKRRLAENAPTVSGTPDSPSVPIVVVEPSEDQKGQGSTREARSKSPSKKDKLLARPHVFIQSRLPSRRVSRRAIFGKKDRVKGSGEEDSGASTADNSGAESANASSVDLSEDRSPQMRGRAPRLPSDQPSGLRSVPHSRPSSMKPPARSDNHRGSSPARIRFADETMGSTPGSPLGPSSRQASFVTSPLPINTPNQSIYDTPQNSAPASPRSPNDNSRSGNDSPKVTTNNSLPPANKS